ncbi:NUMOD4 motif-containing HNH endonuclease [Elizabethkingia meningoseptica]|uniref:NUMOD4 domain-containing protein n=1 Tax=Elizabethkingia TaxID=308865 RepID=UPI0023B19017|nr:NUMOD4 domain-containing protein [Elizabethkingia meningoseptica]MDE5530470.1 NUMOD4 motif-containing HNH endonuclease [Elizabethkingia meningoseptica]MDE5534027.1 NUMOD4 motif-containing HNH endonuclease [Elizabethkingia meningoseptica]MDE5542697.1 NUMOD4 motif-containing HNH endonuclease [Elizabethkingia meningoseptica]
MNTSGNNEVWEYIEDYGYYQISNYGRVKSFHFDKINGHILSMYKPKEGYISVTLSKGGNDKKTFKVHELVAAVFIGKKLYKTRKIDIDHIDGNKQNNHIDNLRYLDKKSHFKKTLKDNPEMLKPMIKYNTEIRPKTVMQYDLNGNFIAEFNNAKDAQRSTGILSRNILMVANKSYYNKEKKLIRKQAGGYSWKFKN